MDLPVVDRTQEMPKNKDEAAYGIALAPEAIGPAVAEELQSTPFIDIHTHLYQPALGRLGLWGIDELLTYHYLEAELFRSSPIRPDEYWALDGPAKADVIWRTLFVDHLPVSEATRGVVAVLSALGLRTDAPDLVDAREYFAKQEINEHIDRVFRLAGIREAVMTNDLLDPLEGVLWRGTVEPDARFHTALRLDRILEQWPDQFKTLQNAGYKVEENLTPHSVTGIRRFLQDSFERMRPVYMALSLPDSFTYPEDSLRGAMLRDVILPSCHEHGIPLALMIGVRRQVNPELRMAGDASGHADLKCLEALCGGFPANRFLVSVLSRENQHELCVYARKFSNLMPFGCWWFLNNPSIVEEITRERIEMLGMTFIPQHSDARILEQIIYKWRNTRRTLAPILANTYTLLSNDGRSVTRDQIRRDIARLFRQNFLAFTGIGQQDDAPGL